ncbi:cilia- and flagella-associated protein 58-like [Physella acuta]|uniref:cilia- and flagella-associated protein 58-like n=1 Tax=Physella acuta TaxID=109671 RepID=UPI0027DC694B|nr:cilia- and flagella-associated protein 58-like [Physella acuta]
MSDEADEGTDQAEGSIAESAELQNNERLAEIKSELEVQPSSSNKIDQQPSQTEREGPDGEEGAAEKEEDAGAEPVPDRLIKLTPSQQEILNDIEPPLTSRTDLQIVVDSDDVLLKKAYEAVKSNFNEAKVQSELRKMYDLYQESQVQNMLLANTVHKYLEKIDRYEARHKRDPRVMAALNMSQRHRINILELDEEKKELQNELLQTKVDLKQAEDFGKGKVKEINKLMEEIKKLREIEKQSEAIETKLMSKENEIQNLKEKFEDELNRSNTQRVKEISELMTKFADDQSTRPSLPEKKSLVQDQLRQEKLTLAKELEECRRYLRIVDDDRRIKTDALLTSRDKNRNLQREIRTLKKLSNTCKTEAAHLENQKSSLYSKCDSLHIDLKRVQGQFESCNNANHDLNSKLTAMTLEHRKMTSELIDTRRLLDHQGRELIQMNQKETARQNEISKRDSEIDHLEKLLKIKQDQNDTLTARCVDLLHKKAKVAHLLNLSETNAMVLVKELTAMHEEIQRQKQIVKELVVKKNHLHANLGIIKNHYLDTAEKSRLLTREVEAHKDFANKMDLKRMETESKLESLMRTNIELYNETNTQAEIEQLQVLQFKQKNKEIKGLQSMNKEKEDFILKMESNTKDLHHQIEQLAAEVISLKAQVEDGKAKILVMTEEIRIMISQMRKAWHTIKEYKSFIESLRRKRDLFGAKLVQATVELDLLHKKIERSEKVMKMSSADHKNMNNDLYILKLEIKSLRAKLRNHEVCQFVITTLRQELSKTAKLLELEKARNVALVATREPIIHRWRALLASDPSKYELYIKINKLTQRLINKTTEVVEKEQLLQNKDLCFMELRALIQRRQMPSLSIEMTLAKNTIRKQQRQIQAITAELNMATDDLSKQQLLTNNQKKEIDKTKKKVVIQQRVNRTLQEKCNRLPPINLRQHLNPMNQLTQGL